MRFTIFFLLLSFLGTEAFAAVGAPSNTELESALQALKKRSPDRHRRILELRKTDPEAFSKNMLAVAREEERLARLRRETPDNVPLQLAMWRNRDKIGVLVGEYREEGEGASREVVESQIDNLLGEQFELRRQMRSNRLKMAERRMERMRDEIRRDPSGERAKFISTWKPKLLGNGARAKRTE